MSIAILVGGWVGEWLCAWGGKGLVATVAQSQAGLLPGLLLGGVRVCGDCWDVWGCRRCMPIGTGWVRGCVCVRVCG